MTKKNHFAILVFFLLTKHVMGYTAIYADSTKSTQVNVHPKLFLDSSVSWNTSESVGDYLEDGLLLGDPFDSVQYYIDRAHAVLNKVRELQNYIHKLDDATSFQLPVGISKTIGGLIYDIAIDKIRLKPTHAELDVFMQFEVPQNGKVLTFMAKGIKFSKAGGIVGGATLQLLGDYAFSINGDRSQIILKGSASRGNTFVTMDCDGFKEMSLDAEVKFSRDLILPELPNGALGEGNVMAAFTTVLSNWNDLVVQISLPPFQLTKLKGFGFTVADAVFDFSDLRNAPNVEFPP